jgi:endonuclease/exonuclease/phosphatase family metal-dependent hydrolase
MSVRHLIRVGCLALLLGLAACGKSDKSVAPEPVNPYLPARVATDSTLEIMTWNIENFAKSGDVTVNYVAEMIRGLDVDVIALQEIASSVYFNKLDAALPEWEGVRATTAYADINLAYLYRTDGRLQVTGVQELSIGSSREFPRRPLALEGAFDGVPFTVVNNHFKCCGNGVIEEGDSWDEEVRRRDASVLLQAWAEENRAGERVFIVGDLNDKLTDAAANNVFQNFLDAAAEWRFADMDIALEGKVVSYPGSNSHIDHILVSNEVFGALDGAAGLVEVVVLQQYVAGGWGTYDSRVSDHLPVVVRLEF